MAATAAAVVGSSFSTLVQSLKCPHYQNYPCDPLPRIIASKRMMLQVGLVSPHGHVNIESLSFTSFSALQKSRRVPRILAALAQEEAAAAAVAAETEEEVVAEEGGREAEEDGSAVNTKLYFGNLPYLCDSAQLAGIIQDYGSPELVEVLYDRDSGKSRGFAFVTMSSVEDCNAVIENLDGREFGGRTLRVNFADKPKPREPLYPETDHKLFVGNLSWSVTSESLTQVFKEYGNVVGARVLYDGETGRSRGYGFVSYSTKSDMETALQILNGVELEGRAIRVSLAEGKKQ